MYIFNQMKASLFVLCLISAVNVSVADSDIGQDAVENGELGRRATPNEIKGWDIDIKPSGAGLPNGTGTVSQGKKLYKSLCISCHDGAEDKPATIGPALIGGQGSLASNSPVKTVGSFWPYATTLYDYIYRAMPFTNPQSLSPDETYAITAYVLYLNGIVSNDTELNAEILPEINMPNKNGFIRTDPRPDTNNKSCFKNCGE